MEAASPATVHRERVIAGNLLEKPLSLQEIEHLMQLLQVQKNVLLAEESPAAANAHPQPGADREVAHAPVFCLVTPPFFMGLKN